jgi:hypothetical protein
MKKSIIAVSLALLLAIGAQAQSTNIVFVPGSIAVLRIGTGSGPQGGTSPYDFASKQNVVFIDEYTNLVGTNSAPAYTVAIPTNGNASLWFNGNAGTEGGMARSGDRSGLAFTGYHGDICSLSPGTAPSSLSYERGIGLVNAFGNLVDASGNTNSLVYHGQAWYGSVAGKTNPRGVVSDGTNEFYGCGSTYGTLQFDAGSDGVYQFQSLSSTRAVKIVNNTLYTTINASDGAGQLGYPAGIYNFVDGDNNPVNLPPPGETVYMNLVVPAFGNFVNVEGFDISPQGNVAYIADNIYGVQKYVLTGGAWRFACNYSVASFNGTDTKDGLGGVLDLTVDYSGTNPVIYATTAESVGYKLGNFNFNRIVKIVDTNTGITGLTFTNVTTIAQAGNTNVGLHSICFVPDLRPLIVGSPANQSVVAGTPARFAVTATASGAATLAGPVTYQWLDNGANINGATSTNYTFGSPQLSDNGSLIQCVVSDFYGSVTSTPPAQLTVTAAPVAPQLGAAQNLTNAIGDNVNITVAVTNFATTPLSYRWYFNGAALSEGGGANGEYSGTTNLTLQISGAQLGVDDGNYSCVVTNIGGSVSNLVATLTLVHLPPVFSVQPISTTALSNSFAGFSTIAYGDSLSYQWYYNSSASGIATFAPVPGATASTYTNNPALVTTNYFVVVSNPGGAITSAPVTLTVVVAPPPSFVAYTNAGQVYSQGFDSMPVATNTTANTGNPVTIDEWVPGNSKDVKNTYSLANPFDFTYPILGSGSVGGLGRTNLNGWYGAGSVQSKLGASQGDQSTGGIISFGTLSANGVAETNRALGLLSTSTTGSSAFGVKFFNGTTNNLPFITLSYTGELWRNQPNVNSLIVGYYIDPTGTNTFVPTNALVNLIPSLYVSFSPSVTLATVDGSQPTNQVSRGMTNLNIVSWPTNAALWLVWQQTNSAGSSQGLAIDNLSFSATNALAPSVTKPILGGVTFNGNSGAANAGLSFGFTNAPGTGFTVWAATNLTLPFSQWVNLGHPTESPVGHYQFIDPQATNNSHRFYRVTQP